MSPVIVVQALDGRWDFGPEQLGAALASGDFGTYPTRAEAKHAAEEAETARLLATVKDNATLLRIMAANSQHLEVGGRAVREWSNFQTGGDVIGRTVWWGQPEWAHGCGMDKAQITATVEKAIAGKRKLCKRQSLLIEAMLYEIEDTRANLAEAA